MSRSLLLGWLAAVSLIFSSPVSAQVTDPKMDAVPQAYVDMGWFMGTVLVVRDGKPALDKGYGEADMEWKIPNSPQVRFRLGSITKQFTAAAILLLEQDGKLKTGDPIKKYLPDAPATWDKVTIYHLLTHTSGIPSFTGFPDYEIFERQRTTPAELVARFRDKPLEFEPGEKWAYNNSAYVLLGHLIEKISGRSYADFLQERIFTPLGMADSGYDSTKKILERRARGYSLSGQGVVNTGYIDMTVPFSAGALYSTTHDLLLWENALFGGKVLSAQALKKMTTPFKQDYGCGLEIKTVDGHRSIGHAGGIEGFNTELRYYPDDKLIVVVLANLNGDAPGKIVEGVTQVAWGKQPKLPVVKQATKIDAAILDRDAGYYQWSATVVNRIARKGDHLFARVTGQDIWTELFPENENSFFLKINDAQLSFRTDASGKVADLSVVEGGEEHLFKRLDEKAALAIDKDAARPVP